MRLIEKFRKENSNSIMNGVYYLSALPKSGAFEDKYIKMRTIEGRIYDDEIVKNLPEINRSHRHYKEWMVRKNSTERLIEYLSKKKRELNILDLGCGNGWLANKLSEINKASVMAVDVNKQELEQAARVFGGKPNLLFAYVDIFDSKLNERKFNIIILAGLLMYFDDISALVNKLKGMLSLDGEIHIIDNALYTGNNVDSAKQRTLEHYKQMGLPEMAGQVHHHLLNELDKHNPEIIYNPHTLMNRINRKFTKPNLSPFFWMKITG